MDCAICHSLPISISTDGRRREYQPDKGVGAVCCGDCTHKLLSLGFPIPWDGGAGGLREMIERKRQSRPELRLRRGANDC